MKKKSSMKKLVAWLRTSKRRKPSVVLTEKMLIKTMKATYDYARATP